MIFDWKFAIEILPILLRASIVTIQTTVASFAVAAIVGLLFALAKSSHRRLMRWPIIGFTEFTRSTPLLVQIYFLYFILPEIGIVLSPFGTGVIGLGFHYSCYTAEAYRAGLESVPKGQWDAALALNYTRYNTFRRIILPQAIPPIIPAMGNYLVAMFKDTPILAAITLVEMMHTASVIGSEKFLYIEPMTIVGMVFLVISVITSFFLRRLEWRLAR